MLKLSALILIACLFLASCGDDTATNSSGGDAAYVLQYPDEAYAMALVEARTLRAPKELVEQIDRELVMIRREWGDSIPAVRISIFRPPWMIYGLHIAVDTAIQSGSDTIGMRLIDSVVLANGASIRPLISEFYTVSPDEPWYPPEAVGLFAGVHGITWIGSTEPGISTIWRTNLRVPNGPVVDWYFMPECDGFLTEGVHQFQVRGRTVRHVRSFDACAIIDSLDWYYSDEASAYMDSVLHNTPEWTWPILALSREMRGCNIRAWPVDYATGCSE